MMRSIFTTFVALLAALSFAVPCAAEDITDVQSRLAEMFPEVEAKDVSRAPVSGLFQVALGAQVAYLSPDGKYLLQGDIFDLDTNENLTERDRGIARISALDSLGRETMLVFSPAEVKQTVTVFTDIDCGYCRRSALSVVPAWRAGHRGLGKS
jgi:thiol:disulfide interchange protein DsbC